MCTDCCPLDLSRIVNSLLQLDLRFVYATIETWVYSGGKVVWTAFWGNMVTHCCPTDLSRIVNSLLQLGLRVVQFSIEWWVYSFRSVGLHLAWYFIYLET